MDEKFIVTRHSDIDSKMMDTVIELKQQHWPYTYEFQKKWIDTNLRCDDVHLLLQVDGQYVAYLCICDIGISIDGIAMNGKGLSNVCVSKDYQKRGYGKKLVEKASEIIRENDYVGILLCYLPLVPFYEKCGWVDVKYDNMEVDKKVFTDVVMSINFTTRYASCMSLNRNI